VRGMDVESTLTYSNFGERADFQCVRRLSAAEGWVLFGGVGLLGVVRMGSSFTRVLKVLRVRLGRRERWGGPVLVSPSHGCLK